MSTAPSFSSATLRRSWRFLCLLLSVALGTTAANATFNAPTMKTTYITVPSEATSTLDFGINYSNGGLNIRQVNLTWQDNSTEEDFFQIEWQVVESGHTTQTWTTLGYAPPNATSYSGVVPYLLNNTTGTLIEFRVYACKGTVNSSGQVTDISSRTASSYGAATFTVAQPNQTLTAPSSLAVSVVAGTDGQLHFTWSDNSIYEELYELYAREDTTNSTYPTTPNAKFSFGASTPDTSISQLTPGKTFKIKIRAARVTAYTYNTTTKNYDPSSYDFSGYSNEATVTMPSTLSPPTALTATTVTENKVRLTWTVNSANADDYVILYRFASTDTFTELGDIGGVSTTVDIPSWYPNTATEWRVMAVQAAHGTVARVDSAQSNSASLTLPFNAPSNVQVTMTTDATTGRPVANVTWTDNSLVESGFAVGVSTAGGGNYSYLFSQSTPNLTSATITAGADMLPGTSYDFVVIAYAPGPPGKSAAVSPNSNLVTRTSLDGITSLEYAPAYYKQAFTPYQLTATHALSTIQSWSITGLPAGLQFNSSLSSGVVSETTAGAGPQEAGLFLCPMTVTYANGRVDTKTLALRVQERTLVPSVPATAGVTVFNVAGTGAEGDTIVFAGGLGFPTFTLELDLNNDGVSSGNIAITSDNAAAVMAAINQAAAAASSSITVSVNGTQVRVTANVTGPNNAVTVVPSNSSNISGISITQGASAIPSYYNTPPVFSSIGGRTVSLTAGTIPLKEFFRDPDTETAVRMHTTEGDIDILMQPSLTPATTQNFMNYVNNGDYNGTAFHRVSPGFVIQGGGYKPTTAPNNFVEVTPRPSPTNEPGIPNVQGTIALAKSSNPNSGTHDFFISLADNRNILDTSSSTLDGRTIPNGGFTVFARIARTTATTATQSAITNLTGTNQYKINLTQAGSSTPITDFNPIGDSGLGNGTFWPLRSASALSTMDNTKCSLINSFENIPVLSYGANTSNSAAVIVSVDSQNNLVLQAANGALDGANSTITVSATDLDGNVAVQTFVATVNNSYAPAAITTQPATTAKLLGSDVTFSVGATGSNTIHYQWRKGSKAIAGETNASLTLHNITLADAADYRVLVSNDANAVLSDAATLTVQLPPSIVTPPVAKTVNFNAPATFSVVASGDPTLLYQWYHDDVLIQGATSASYTIAHAQISSGGAYKVSVSNSTGAAPAVSTPVTLTVTRIDTDGDGLFDDQEITLGTSPYKADTDGDGYSDSVENTLGTDPRLATKSPATTYFVAQNEGGAALTSLAMKNIPASPNFRNALTGANVIVPQQWMTATELTNEQFATVLDIALNQMKVIEIVAQGDRRFVRYPKTTGQILCYLAPLPSAPAAGVQTPPSCDVGADSQGTTFYVSKALAKSPVRAVSWYGAYLASAALNSYYGTTSNGYDNKCTANWSYAGTKGYFIPTYVAWDWAAGGGVTPYPLYPTGATVTSTQAYFGNTSATAAPKAVKSYAANKYGLYDMAGNVAEWIQEETTGPTTGYVKGGSFASPSSDLLNSASQALSRDTISDKVGIRLALQEDVNPSVSNLSHRFVQAGDAIELSVTSGGAPPLTYQWYKNKVAIAGKTSSSLIIQNSTAADAANYSVSVKSNTTNTSTTAEVSVSVLTSPVPIITVLPGQSATLKAVVTTPIPATLGNTFSYEWRKIVGSSLSDPLSASPTYVISTATNSATGTYVCKVTPPGNRGLSALTASVDVIVVKSPAAAANLASSVTMPTAVVGGAYSINPFSSLLDTATDRTPTKYTVTGLPDGLTCDPKTGLITGRPTGAGTNTTIEMTVSNGAGTLKIPASFILDVKALPTAAVGTFVAKIAANTALSGGQGGRLDFTCTDKGVYTGTLILGGSRYSFVDYLGATVSSNVVSSTASSTVVIPRPNKTSVYLTFTVDISSTAATHLLAGSIGEIQTGTLNVVNSVNVDGWRRLDFASATASSLGRFGYHTLAMNPPTSNTDPAQVPQGSTFFTASVVDSGNVTQAGRLADGTSLTCSSPMSYGGDVLMFQSLYSNKGSILGAYNIANGHAITLASSGVSWFKQPTTDRNYKDGFAALSLVFGTGGLYTPPAGVPVMGLVDNDVNNAEAVFTGGGQPAPGFFKQAFKIKDSNACVFDPTVTFNPHSVTGSVNKDTGVFTGTFKIPGTTVRSGTYWGVITPKKDAPTIKSAYGAFTLPTTSAATSPMLSGSLVIQPH